MPKTPKSKKIILIVLILVILFGTLFYFSRNTLTQNSLFSKVEKKETGPTVKTILEVNNNRYEDEVNGQISVYDFMDKLRGEKKISFTEKTYIGMGKFINSIDGIENNGDKNWIYYVNGVKAQIGVSNYEIKPGDVVSWKYEKFNY